MKYIFFISLLIFSCKEKDKFHTYTIKSGKHSSGLHAAPFNSSVLDFEASFNSSAIYKTSDPKNQSDINKLFGFSDCNTKHHENSARFGWSWTDSLNIYAYAYAGGVVKNKLITSIKLDSVYRFIIYKSKGNYVFFVNDKSTELARGCWTQEAGYLLYPYFGGTETAPQDVTIKIKVLK